MASATQPPVAGNGAQIERYGPGTTVDFERLGDCGATILRSEDGWIHRRVEKVYLGPNAMLERSISIDFSVPDAVSFGAGSDHRPVTYLPVSVLRKRPPIMDLDLRDEHGKPLPLLTSEQNAEADRAALVKLAREVVNGAHLSQLLRLHLQHITGTNKALARRALGAVLEPRPGIRDRKLRLELRNDQRFVELASLLVESAVLWIPVMNEPGRRRIVKVRYQEPPASTLLPVRTLLAQLGWAPSVHWLELPHMGGEVSYHLHVRAQPFMKILDADLIAVSRPGADLPRPRANVQIVRERAHLYLHQQRAKTEGLAWVEMRVQRSGELLGTWIASLGITVLLAYCWEAWRHLILYPTEVVAILVIVPIVMVAYVARPVHRLHAQQVLSGVRFLLGFAGTLPIVAALVLISGSAQHTHTAWGWLTVAAAVISGLLTIPLLPRGMRRGRKDHGATSAAQHMPPRRL